MSMREFTAALILPFCLALGACHCTPALPPMAEVPANAKAITPELHGGTEQRHERFNAISKEGKAKLVFLGDSITQGWEGSGKDVWAQYYGNREAANFGISGDRTEHVLWRLDHGNFDGLSPKLIVIMIGTNNTGHRKDPATETAAGIKAIIDRLEKKCPDSTILLLAIFPRGEKPEDDLRKLNEDANRLIKMQADGKKVVWLDINAKFLDANGVLPKAIMPDFLHPQAEGYKIWAEAMEPEIKRLLGE